MTGLPHALETPLRTGILSTLRRARRLEERTVVAPSEEIVHCRLCGSPHRAGANHLCPRLYGR
jgi:hypothetical protein